MNTVNRMSDTVYIKTSQTQPTQIYHTDKDCRVFPDRYVEATEQKANTRGLEECDVCAGNCDTSREGIDPWKYHKKAKEIANES